jgi:ribulose-phosphate 3-epimerase
MPEVIPSINCHAHDTECVRRILRKAEEFSKWIHLDVADAVFTYNKTWADASSWQKFLTPLKLEVHLMVEDPEKTAEEWLKAGARRIIVHIETPRYSGKNSFENLLSLCKKHKAELMLSQNPEASAEKFLDFRDKVNHFQILAVHPGPSGQKFLPLVLHKVSFLQKEIPKAIIEVDGGIDEITAKKSKSAGADILVSGSYLLRHDNPHEAYKTLRSS